MHNTPHSEEAKRKISEKKKGSTPWNKEKRGSQIAWNKGRVGVYSEETIEKMKKARIEYHFKRRKPFLEKYCECDCGILLPNANRGQKFIAGHNRKGKNNPNYGRANWNSGLTKETDLRLLKMSKNKKGKSSWNKGKTKEDFPQFAHSEESKNRIRETMKRKGLGKKEKNGNWKGGTSFLPYSIEFNAELKNLIRFRDNYTCQLCGMPQTENIRKLDVHHIDSNKENSIPSNLISLCKNCHSSKVPRNSDKWKKYFSIKIEEIMNPKKMRLLNVRSKHIANK